LATAGRSFEVKFTGDTSNLTKSFKQLEKGSGVLGKTFGGISKAGTAAFAAIGISSAASALAIGVNSVKAAIADQEAQKKLARTLQNVTNATDSQIASTEKWISSQQFAYGISDSVLRPALENLVRATGDVGKAQEMMALAQDIAAGTGRDLTAITLSLAKSYGGNFAALSRLGIVIPDNIKKSKDYGKVTEYLNGLFKGQAATAANTFAGRMKRLGERVGELKETIGALLLPVLNDLFDFIDKNVIPAVERIADAFGKSADDGVKTLVGEVRNLIGGLEGAAKNVYLVILAITSIKISTAIVLGLRTAWIAVATAEGGAATASVIAAGVIKRAMASTGIGLLILAIGGVVAALMDSEIAARNMGDTMTTEQKVATVGFTQMRYAVGGIIPEIDAAALAATRLGDAADDAARRVAVATGRKATTAATKTKLPKTPKTNVGKATKDTNKFADAQKMAADVVAKLNTRLEDLRGKLATAKDAYATFASSVADSIRSTLNYQTAYESTGGFIKGLEDQARNAINFGSKIAQLISMGLNESAINQILTAGADTGTKIADEILAGGASAITKVNDLTKAVDSVAVNVGKVGATQFYQAGVSQAQAMVDGFVSALKKAGFGFVDGQVALPSKLAKGLEKGKLTKAQQKQLSGMLGKGKGLETSKIAAQQYQVQANPTAFPVTPTTTTVVNNITVTAGVGDPVAIGKQVVDSLVAYQKKNGVIPVKTKTA